MKNSHFLLPLAALAGLALSANAATIAGDGIASFDIGNGGPGSGDITNNPNGLAITGQSGAWASITTSTASATDDGVTLTFNGGTVPIWGGTSGDDRGTGSNSAIRIGSFLGGATDIPWTISGLTAGAFYDMIWYNKRVSPGETRHPNTGVAGFDAGNGAGASAPLDADQDQNFIGVQADGSGTISGTWFLAGGTQDITAVTGVQIGTSGGPVAVPNIIDVAVDGSGNVILTLDGAAAGLTVEGSDDLTMGSFGDVTGATPSGNTFTIPSGEVDPDMDGKDFYRVRN